MRADLKDERDVVFLTESGRLFHNIGAEKEKAPSPYVTEFTVGRVKRISEDERKLRCGWYCTIWDARYKNTSVHGCLAHMEYSEITVLVIAYSID